MKGFKATLIEKDVNDLKIRLEDDTEIWVNTEYNVSSGGSGEVEENLEDKMEFIAAIMPSITSFETDERDFGELGIIPLKSGKLQNKIITEAKKYGVEDRWEEADRQPHYPLVELDTGFGKMVIAHENVPPVEEKQ